MNDSTGWVEVKSTRDIAQLLGLPGEYDVPMKLLLEVPTTASYLQRIEQPAESEPGLTHSLMFRQHVFINLGEVRRKGWVELAIAISLSAYLHDLGSIIPATVSVVKVACENVNRLTDEQRNVIRAIIATCDGNPYKHPTDEEALKIAVGPSVELDQILDELEDLKIIVGSRRTKELTLTH